jgi:hypothetical protein
LQCQCSSFSFFDEGSGQSVSSNARITSVHTRVLRRRRRIHHRIALRHLHQREVPQGEEGSTARPARERSAARDVTPAPTSPSPAARLSPRSERLKRRPPRPPARQGLGAPAVRRQAAPQPPPETPGGWLTSCPVTSRARLDGDAARNDRRRREGTRRDATLATLHGA